MPSSSQTRISMYGSRFAYVPTAPEILPTAAPPTATAIASPALVSSSHQYANLSPKDIGSA